MGCKCTQKEMITLQHLMSLCIEEEDILHCFTEWCVCVCTHLLFTVYQCARGYSLEALFESSVNLLQSFGLWLSGAAASLVS